MSHDDVASIMREHGRLLPPVAKYRRVSGATLVEVFEDPPGTAWGGRSEVAFTIVACWDCGAVIVDHPIYRNVHDERCPGPPPDPPSVLGSPASR